MFKVYLKSIVYVIFTRYIAYISVSSFEKKVLKLKVENIDEILEEEEETHCDMSEEHSFVYSLKRFHM